MDRSSDFRGDRVRRSAEWPARRGSQFIPKAFAAGVFEVPTANRPPSAPASPFDSETWLCPAARSKGEQTAVRQVDFLLTYSCSVVYGTCGNLAAMPVAKVVETLDTGGRLPSNEQRRRGLCLSSSHPLTQYMKHITELKSRKVNRAGRSTDDRSL
ncbi:hypothetical protein BDA96_10G100500 [Sorghum bicolor]|uniref:Uncharacterized protein n=1 Tax=Sorghum bicolor TaxID=4558 RepID=A0A921TZU6_SORBI|nr:hypothetical protein BDA96_10G100500 [Sorghum bicolor]